jgi:hypothetical protein
MTDFLTSVTARSFGAETAIRPRVASLFEPVRSSDTALRDAPPEEPGAAVVASEVEAASGGARKKLSEDDLASAVVPQPRLTSAPRDTSVPVDKTMEKAEATVAAKIRPHRTPTSSHPENPIVPNPSFSGRTDEVARETPQRTQFFQAANSNVSPASSSRSDTEDGAPKRVPARALATSPTHDEPFELNHRGLVLAPKIVDELTARMKNAAAAMNAGSSGPARKKREYESPAADPEPSVHVTIGRIEVRATSESKHVGPTRAASAVMSLEEYLNRRTQRGNRE